jgi:quercetin dioxygenase-like cupin family protein
MKRFGVVVAAVLLVVPVLHAARGDQPAGSVVVKPVLSTGVTASGQPIVLPRKDVHVVVSTYDIPAGANLPEHEHPFARYAYVLAGALRVTNTATGKSETYKAGDFIVEAIGQWHKAANIGPDAVKLVVIDQVAGTGSNTVLHP